MEYNKKKKRKLYKMEVSENLEDSGVFAISLVSEPAIEELFVYMSSKNFQMIQLAEVSNEKRILIGPVLIPNKEIPRIDDETGEEYAIIFSPDVVERAAQLFLQQQKNNNATLEHTAELDDISVVESWLIEDSLKDKSQIYNMTYPKGTWMVKMKINNDSVWEDYVKTGKVRGFSLEGMFGHKLVEASKTVEDNASILLKMASIADTEFAEEMLAQIKGIIRKDLRYKDGKTLELESYSDYPDAVKNAAKRGIELNEKVNNKCATSVGKIRAQQLAQGKPISIQTIKRMYAYTSRAREFYNPDDTMACGTISYLLWGGDPANRWSASKLKELGLFNLSKQEFDIPLVELAEYEQGPCQEGYVQIGMKDKDGRMVPNCVPEESVKLADYPFEKCLEDRAKDGYDEESAKRICGYIRWYVASAEKLTVEELETAVSIASSYAGQFGDGEKKKPFKNGTYIAPALLTEEGNLNVLGYNTKYFYICPGAQATFEHLTSMLNDEDTKGMIRSAAQIADNIFKIEDEVIKAKIATPEQFSEAIILVNDFKDLIHEIDEESGMIHDISYMDGHLETIGSYLPKVE